MILPDYLNEIADEVRETEHEVTFISKCLCGNKNFIIAKNRVENDENNPFDDYWNSRKVPIFSLCSAVDKKNGKEYTYGTTFFGIRVGKFYNEDIPEIDRTRILKIKCSECGKQFILFDSRYHGYDAISEKERLQIKSDKEYIFSWGRTSGEVKVKINNDLTLTEFLEEFKTSCVSKDYPNAFTNIIVYHIINGKKKKVFEEETA